ncbi:serine hydrolase [Candidatus Daviesbacteria bacterium]|nr:serine hydrolase [Candidatus Daviesbacteria bacterium]
MSPLRYVNLDRPKPKKSRKRFYSLITVVSLLLIYFIFIRQDNDQKALSQAPSPTSSSQVLLERKIEPPEVLPTLSTANSLEDAVGQALKGTKGTYAISIQKLNSNETFNKDEDRVFEAGSLYKLWVMGEAFSQIEEGILKMDTKLSQDIKTLNEKFRIDEDLAEQKEGGITLTVSQALIQMITISHNYAALLLTEKLRLSQVANYLKEKGFNETSVGTSGAAPKTTASDLALFLEKLYTLELANETNTKKMIDLLKAQKLNNKIPKNLPDGVEVAHKTGELGWFSHDAGIVYTSKGDYIIVVLSESSNPKGAEERIALISQAVYEYFTK